MKKSISVFAVLLLSLMAFAMLPPSAAQGYAIEELWTNPMQVNDVAVSKDGNFVAAVNDTGLYYFSWDSSSPRWWYLSGGEDRFLSVAISANGQYVIMGNSTNGSIYYFGGCTTRIGLQAPNSYDWLSHQFQYWSPAGNNDVDRRTIDISDNGEYVVVGGTGEQVYYFINCTTKSGTGVNWDWYCYAPGLVHAIDMSPDGRYVVAGGPSGPGSSIGFVIFFKDANLPGPHSFEWWNGTLTDIVDVAVSDDGYSASAVSPLTGVPATIYYWAGASSMHGLTNVNANWSRMHGFSSVDLSSDGNRVVAGYAATNVGSLHYWDGALTLSGNNVNETWVRVPDTYVFDVGISDDGGLLLGGTAFPNCALFYTNDGILVGNFTLEAPAAIVSMAGSGSSAAVGTGRFTTSLHFYRIITANAVGGEILSLEGLMLLAPYLAVALVAGTVAVAMVLVFSSRRAPNH